MNTLKKLSAIIEILETGKESDMYVSTVRFLFNRICEEKKAGTYNVNQYFENAIQVHNRLRTNHGADFNGQLLMWYRRFIGLYEETNEHSSN